MNEHTTFFKNTLTQFGFSEKEVQVYLALLTLGKGTVSKITQAAHLNRTTGYDILNTLVQKGVITISGKEPKQEYVAESPQKIIQYLKKKLADNERNLKKAQEMIPELTSLHNKSGRPKVRFYEGKQGLEEVYEDTLTSHEPIRAYAAIDDMHKALPEYFPKYYKRRAGKKINIRGIVPATQVALERSQHNKEEAREMALVPAEKFYFSPEINIYDNKIMIASWREELGIIIESEEIADAMKKIYELAWAEAKRLDTQIRSKNKHQENPKKL